MKKNQQKNIPKNKPTGIEISKKEIDDIVKETSGLINPKPIENQRNKNAVSYDPEFFKNFEITIENKTYYFSPWNEVQKVFLTERLNSLKNLILKYAERPKDSNKKSPRFPYKEFKSEISSVLRMFFNYSNLKIDFDLENKLDKLCEKEPENGRKKKTELEGKITSEKLLKDEKMLTILNRVINNWSKPRSREDLKASLLEEKEEELKRATEKIIQKTRSKFFPYLEYNMSINNKKIIIKQIENFVRTIENSINQVV